MAAPPKPPTREIGSTNGRQPFPGLPTWTDLEPDPRERVDALIWPESTFTYPKMLDDGQVQALALGVLMPVRSQWRQVLNPGTLPSELAQKLADDLDIPLKGQDRAPAGRRTGRVHNGRHRASALRALWVGHAVYELVAEIDQDGHARLIKLAHRPQHTIGRWHANARGDWTGIEQQPAIPPKPIPRNKLCVYTWGDDTDGDPRGRSLLRAIYKNWNLKDRLVRIDVMGHERHGVGWAKGKITDARGATQRDTLLEIGAGLQAGEDTTVVVPEGTDMSMEGLSGTVSDPIASARYHDEQMARALLAMVLQLGQTETGSRSLGEVHMDLLGMFQASIAAWEADTATEQIVEPWVGWNLGDLGIDTGACVEAERVDDAPPSVEALATVIGAGLLDVDPGIQAWVRERLGLPEEEPLPDDLSAIMPDDGAEIEAPVEEFAGADITPTSTMVALYPPPGVAHALAVEDGEDPASMHVTLAYLGDTLDDRLQAIVRAVQNTVDQSNLDGLSGEIAGSGTFTGGETPVQVALVDLPNLPSFRQRLVEELRYAETPASTVHGFTPHITLRYGDGAPPAVGPLPLAFDHVRVVRGDQEVARIPITPRRDDHDHPHSFAAGDPLPMPDRTLGRAPTAKEIAARVDPRAIDAAHDMAVDEITAILAELRQALGAGAIDVLRNEVDVHDTGESIAAALGAGGFADRLLRRVLGLVPRALVDRLAAALGRADAVGAQQVRDEARRQGAPERAVSAPATELHVPAAEAMAASVAREVTHAVATEATRRAPRSEPAGAPVADATAVAVGLRERPTAPDAPPAPAPAVPDAPGERLPLTPGAPMDPPRATKATAAGAAAEAQHQGRIRELQARETDIDDLFAMELLDARTCGPCGEVDNKTYDTLADAIRDYPTGTYVNCEGREFCRGRLVALFVTQQD
jgi:2'-5' RNA ligase